MTSTLPLKSLAEATSFDDFHTALSAILEKTTVAELARELGVDYQQVYNISKKRLPSAKVTEFLAKKLAKICRMNEEMILANLFKCFDRKLLRRDQTAEILSKTSKSSQRCMSRPTYHWFAGGIGGTATYTTEEEERDVAEILAARENPSKIVQRPQHKFDLMLQTGKAKEIGYTREESLRFEARNLLTEVRKTTYFSEAVYYVGKIHRGLLPRNKLIDEALGERGVDDRWCSSWENKLKALGLNEEEANNLFPNKVLEIALASVKNLRSKRNTEPCEDYFENITRCIPFIKGGWTTLGLTCAEATMFAEKSMKLEAQRMSQSGEGHHTIIKIMDKWGLSWESVGTSPKIMVSKFAEDYLKKMLNDNPVLFALPGAREALQEILSGLTKSSTAS